MYCILYILYIIILYIIYYYEVWRKYYEKVLNDGGRLGVQDEVESEKGSDGNELMCECLTREEVEQALGSLKRNQPPWEVTD